MYSLRGLQTARGLILTSTNVGDLRYGVNLPVAGFLRLLGFNMAGLHAWALLCSLGEIALVFVVAMRLWGLPAAALAASLLATAPLHVHVGGRALADAPLAFFMTLAFVSFFFAERRAGRWLYALAGASVGFSWWIKPHAIIFGLVLIAYAALQRRWAPVWWLVFASATMAILLEWSLLGALFGDPFVALHALTSGISENFVKQDAPWGDHAAFFYFRQMFLDGRDMALMPLFALPGLWMVLLRPHSRGLLKSGYVVLWGVGMLAVFSFLPYSFSPLKLIPKQENYALMFFAPVALLGGYGMSQIRPAAIRYLLLLASGVTGAALASLPQHQVRIGQATLEFTIAYALSHPQIVVYLPSQALNVVRVRSLMAAQHGMPSNVRPLQELVDGNAGPASAPVVAFMHPRWPEMVRSRSIHSPEQRLACLAPIGTLAVTSPDMGQRILDGLVALRSVLRPVLHDVLGRQLGFAVYARNWPDLAVYGCGVDAADFRPLQGPDGTWTGR